VASGEIMWEFARRLRTLRGSALSWVGIVGGSVTLFGNLDAALSLADWARWFVDHWQSWLREMWRAIFYLLGIRDDPNLRFDLTFSLFLVLIALGSRMEAIRSPLGAAPLSWSSFGRSSLSFACALAGYAAFGFLVAHGLIPGVDSPDAGALLAGALLWGILFLAVMHWPTIDAFGTATVLQAFLFLMYAHSGSELDSAQSSLLLSVAVIGVGGFLAFWVADPRKFHARLWFMLGGIVVLAALNALSQLHINIR
jgi:hypothetical protein